MSPKFAKAVDPVFLYMMELMDRIERDGSGIDPNQERIRVKKRIDHAENILGQTPDWELAKYALVGWIDQLLISAPWNGANWWQNNDLEFEYFHSGKAFEHFFVAAKDAQALSSKDALEVYYICVVLGFRGLYGHPNSLQYTQHYGLPNDLDSWAKQTAAALQLGQGRSPVLERPEPGEGAPPLSGYNKLINMSLFAVIMAAVCFGYIMMFGMQRGS